MRRPSPQRAAAHRSTAVAALVVLLAGCGSPPEPLPTGPPRVRGSESAGPSGLPIPPGGTLPPTGIPTLPTGGLPPGGLPGYPTGLPTYPTVVPTLPTRTVSPSPSRSLPPGAPVCRSGPTKAQMLALLKDHPGLPAGKRLEVRSGPYCAGSWQLALLGIVGEPANQAEELLMVSTGRPSSLTLVAAGTDVCTDRVEDDAPVGIRVRACGF